MKQRMPAWQVVLFVSAVMVAGLLIYRQIRISKEQAKESQQRDDAQIRETDALLRRLTAGKDLADQRAKLARDIWDEFDALPASKKTPQLIEAYVARGQAFAEGVAEPWATQIRVGTAGNGRGRIATLTWPDARAEATNDVYDVLVPSKDPKTCEERATQAVTEDAIGWRSWGFRLVRCPSTEDSPKTWVLP